MHLGCTLLKVLQGAQPEQHSLSSCTPMEQPTPVQEFDIESALAQQMSRHALLPLSYTEVRKWGVRSLVVEIGVFGAPPLIFRPEVPKAFKNRYLGTSGLKNGAPPKRQILPRRI